MRAISGTRVRRLSTGVAGVIALAGVLAACSKEDLIPKGASNGSRSEDGRLPQPVVTLNGGAPYRVQLPASIGSVTGIVEVTGEPPRDSSFTPAVEEQKVCGAQAQPPALDIRQGKLEDAVAWLADARTGKPMSSLRRYELDVADCALEPAVQAVSTQGTLNVANADDVLHRLELVDQGTSKIVAVAPYTDKGSLIPFDDILKEPRLLEVQSRERPWMRAWVAVFDHPYYTTSDEQGVFTLDSVPAGTYRLKVWHPRLGVIEQPVTVTAGRPVSVTATFSIRQDR